jgi:hypothetical protein
VIGFLPEPIGPAAANKGASATAQAGDDVADGDARDRAPGLLIFLPRPGTT